MIAHHSTPPADLANDTDSPVLADEAETAEYIADFLDQLEKLARTHGLVKLQYRLIECRDEARRFAAG
ncbi:MAG: hypothetical protein KDA46_04185 [Parvularculaceae bacterium]|nr:hypothetical protein [Parvularculaceae bacterium]